MVPATAFELHAQLIQFLTEAYYVSSPDELDADTPLIETGILDSTGILELVAHLEEQYGVRVRDEDIIPENMNSIARLGRYILRRR
jgi:acyl carrier protein